MKNGRGIDVSVAQDCRYQALCGVWDRQALECIAMRRI